jgi:hypothetical protein
MSPFNGYFLLGFIVRYWLGILHAWLWGVAFIGVAFLIRRRWFAEEGTHDAVTIFESIVKCRYSFGSDR